MRSRAVLSFNLQRGEVLRTNTKRTYAKYKLLTQDMRVVKTKGSEPT